MTNLTGNLFARFSPNGPWSQVQVELDRAVIVLSDSNQAKKTFDIGLGYVIIQYEEKEKDKIAWFDLFSPSKTFLASLRGGDAKSTMKWMKVIRMNMKKSCDVLKQSLIEALDTDQSFGGTIQKMGWLHLKELVYGARKAPFHPHFFVLTNEKMFILPHPLTDISILRKAESVNLVESSLFEIEEHLTLEHRRSFLFLFLWAEKSLLLASETKGEMHHWVRLCHVLTRTCIKATKQFSFAAIHDEKPAILSVGLYSGIMLRNLRFQLYWSFAPKELVNTIIFSKHVYHYRYLPELDPFLRDNATEGDHDPNFCLLDFGKLNPIYEGNAVPVAVQIPEEAHRAKYIIDNICWVAHNEAVKQELLRTNIQFDQETLVNEETDNASEDSSGFHQFTVLLLEEKMNQALFKAKKVEKRVATVTAKKPPIPKRPMQFQYVSPQVQLRMKHVQGASMLTPMMSSSSSMPNLVAHPHLQGAYAYQVQQPRAAMLPSKMPMKPTYYLPSAMSAKNGHGQKMYANSQISSSSSQKPFAFHNVSPQSGQRKVTQENIRQQMFQSPEYYGIPLSYSQTSSQLPTSVSGQVVQSQRYYQVASSVSTTPMQQRSVDYHQIPKMQPVILQSNPNEQYRSSALKQAHSSPNTNMSAGVSMQNAAWARRANGQRK